MKVKNSILLFILITILSGCNVVSSGSIPEDISKKYYKMFVESYELYEERVQEYNGQFVDTATYILSGIEAMHMIKKKQVHQGVKSAQNRKEFIDKLFGIVS